MAKYDRTIGNEPTAVLKFESGDEFIVPSDFALRDAVSHVFTPEVNGKTKKIIKELLSLDKRISKKDDRKVFVNGEHVSVRMRLDKENKIEIGEKFVA